MRLSHPATPLETRRSTFPLFPMRFPGVFLLIFFSFSLQIGEISTRVDLARLFSRAFLWDGAETRHADLGVPGLEGLF